jgi:beta-glucosidase
VGSNDASQQTVFPRGFIWGAATSSYQVEGGVGADGKGLSVWDTFCQKPGKIWNGQTGETACDHYHRWSEDVALMQAIGLQAYRFSVSWSRLLPAGTGKINPAGLDFYDRLVDALLAVGITPYLTLFHWDYPEALYQQGGWLSPDSPAWFSEYAKVLVDLLSDRVVNWITMNEPQVHLGMGHHWGIHAPGDNASLSETLCMMHHAALAHGLAAQVIRARSKQPVRIGFASAAQICIPATNKLEDIEAARQQMFSVTRDTYIWNNTWFSDPLFLKHYPADGLKLFAAELPNIQPEDLRIIGQPLDFYAFNTYSGSVVRANNENKPEIVNYPDGHPMMMSQWYINPEILYWGPKFFYERYRLPILITENGMSNLDWVARDGQVHDAQRIDYIARHLLALERAIQEGVDVQGYFYWSLLDNFEWSEGFKQRFGLVYVDFPTQKRVLKNSARWYRELILSNGKLLSTYEIITNNG